MMVKSKKKLALIFAAAVLLGGGLYLRARQSGADLAGKLPDADVDSFLDADEQMPVPTPLPATSQDLKAAPRDTSALGGYNVLIADRGNNRLVELTPDKRIVWEYRFDLPKLGLGADDAFFADRGKSVIVNLEEWHLIEIIDYATKQVKWSYGLGGHPGRGGGYLNTPDDAYQLPNGDVTVADIKNCRVIEISPDKQIVRQYGVTKDCGNRPGRLHLPNGDTPRPDGHVLISNIATRDLVELNQNWQAVFGMPLPVKYPSDPQVTAAGNILISDYSNPGQIVEVSRQGAVVWKFGGQAGELKMNKPSLAVELPNGNILSNDDLNHRVIVIDKKTRQIVWQYGVTGKPGSGPGQLNIPDGVDIIRSDHLSANQPVPVGASARTVGQVSRHAQTYLNQVVAIAGYVLAQNGPYAIVSDEPGGHIGLYDLPVTGPGVADLKPGQKYLFQGTLVSGGLNSINQNPNHLELSTPPQISN